MSQRDSTPDFERICRLCMEEQENRSKIFSTLENLTVSLHQMIMTCTSIVIYEGDGLPDQICSKCLGIVKQSYFFREQAEQADAQLREILLKAQQNESELKTESRNMWSGASVCDSPGDVNDVVKTEFLDDDDDHIDDDVEICYNKCEVAVDVKICGNKGEVAVDNGLEEGEVQFLGESQPGNDGDCNDDRDGNHCSSDEAIDCDEKAIQNEHDKTSKLLKTLLQQTGITVTKRRDPKRNSVITKQSVIRTKSAVALSNVQSQLRAKTAVANSNVQSQLRAKSAVAMSNLQSQLSAKSAVAMSNLQSELRAKSAVAMAKRQSLLTRSSKAVTTRQSAVAASSRQSLKNLGPNVAATNKSQTQKVRPVAAASTKPSFMKSKAAAAIAAIDDLQSSLARMKAESKTDNLKWLHVRCVGDDRKADITKTVNEIGTEMDNGKIYCKECKIFIGRPYFYNHVKFVHIKVRDHLCAQCGYRAQTGHILRQHIDTVHGDTSYPCSECDKVFKSKKAVKDHIRKGHTEGSQKERSHICQFCGKGFFTAHYLRNHIRTHTHETPYKCKFCDRRFSFKWPCTTHERLHTGVKPYKCTVCSESFTQNCVRKNHEYRAHGNEEFNPKNRKPREGLLREKKKKLVKKKSATLPKVSSTSENDDS